jgi:ribosomal-protein-alanine N-acetyltransferase
MGKPESQLKRQPEQTVFLESPSPRRMAEFIAAVRRSRDLYGHWAAPPRTAEQYKAFLQRVGRPTHFAHLVCTRANELVGAININEVVRGVFQSGYLGCYAFVPHAGRGYMRQGLELVLRLAFRRYGLHRLEANVQPDNVRSTALVRGLGFRLEGYSPRYLKLAGRWREHERWALTIEDWKTSRARVVG